MENAHSFNLIELFDFQLLNSSMISQLKHISVVLVFCYEKNQTLRCFSLDLKKRKSLFQKKLKCNMIFWSVSTLVESFFAWDERIGCNKCFFIHIFLLLIGLQCEVSIFPSKTLRLNYTHSWKKEKKQQTKTCTAQSPLKLFYCLAVALWFSLHFAR